MIVLENYQQRWRAIQSDSSLGSYGNMLNLSGCLYFFVYVMLKINDYLCFDMKRFLA